MKKRYLIPSLLLLSTTALTACSGEVRGLIDDGQPYVEGQAKMVKREIQEQAENSFNKVTIKTKTSVSIKTVQDGRSLTVKASNSGNAAVDINNRAIDYKCTISASVMGFGGSSSYNLKAKEENGTWIIKAGKDYEGQITSDALDVIFNRATYEVYAWNYVLDESKFDNLLTESDLSSTDSNTVKDFYDNLSSNIVFSGDIESGTFDVGFAQALEFNTTELKCSFNKMRYSYKDGLLRSIVIGLKLDLTSEDNDRVIISATNYDTFSYNTIK